MPIRTFGKATSATRMAPIGGCLPLRPASISSSKQLKGNDNRPHAILPDMAKKESDFDKLARLIKEEGEDIRAEIRNEISGLNKKVDGLEKNVDAGFARVDRELSDIHSELRTLRHDLDDLRREVENISGYRKEIDHALERIAVIEKHLGIGKKVVA
ncbi:hypothetical protein QA635_38970 [Bradyrhizobium brasilense]|uniref:hypothetical protein n=1 Tax=Bradyrhizobium brasilense TaxID=1419277 RepID=UPI0024B22B1A|nr:hypothetical protein [Bradyrhizobium australafricanum]WFU32397.1 hypothetical protein QA635_38970 [Bradyrhizobium australafricanum]